MKILILGARGMLGQALVRAFNAPFNSPSSPSYLKRGVGGVTRKGELLAWDRDGCDITDRQEVMKKIADAHPTLIINAAAYNDVDGAEKNPDLANRVNGDAVGYLAEAAASVGAVFVQYSTDYVFDGVKREGYREDDAPHPISAYGRSKFLGEQKIQNAEFRIQNYYLIRTSRLFGRQGSGKKSFVDVMLERAKDGDTISVIDEEVSSPTYVEDLAKRTFEIIKEKRPSGIYHVTNSGTCTWYGFAQEIFKQTLHAMVPIVKPVPASHFSRPAKRPAYSQLLNTKLPPLRPWQDALRAYLTSDLRE